MRLFRAVRRPLLVLLLASGSAATVLLAGAARAQQLPTDAIPDAPAPPPDGVWRVRGEIVRPGARGMVGAVGATVTLHRVGSDTAHPLDSTRAVADGRYAFDYRRSGTADAIYFVSATWGGITYFSQPLRAAAVTGQPAEISVFDTTSRAVPITVRGRHVIVSSPRTDERRDVVEVYEITNDSSVTLVAGDGGKRATWSAIVPAEATNLRAGEGGDVTSDAMAMRDGRVLIFAPIAPGIKQLSFAYSLPRAAFPLSLPAERATEVFEVLVQDSAGVASGAGMHEEPPVSVRGGLMRRYLAQNVPANGVVRIELPASRGGFRALFVAVVVTMVGAAMLIGLARALSRRRPTPVTASGLAPADRLAREIAALDAAFAAQATPTADARAAYEARRAELKGELATLVGGKG